MGYATLSGSTPSTALGAAYGPLASGVAVVSDPLTYVHKDAEGKIVFRAPTAEQTSDVSLMNMYRSMVDQKGTTANNVATAKEFINRVRAERSIPASFAPEAVVLEAANEAFENTIESLGQKTGNEAVAIRIASLQVLGILEAGLPLETYAEDIAREYTSDANVNLVLSNFAGEVAKLQATGGTLSDDVANVMQQKGGKDHAFDQLHAKLGLTLRVNPKTFSEGAKKVAAMCQAQLGKKCDILVNSIADTLKLSKSKITEQGSANVLGQIIMASKALKLRASKMGISTESLTLPHAFRLLEDVVGKDSNGFLPLFIDFVMSGAMRSGCAEHKIGGEFSTEQTLEMMKLQQTDRPQIATCMLNNYMAKLELPPAEKLDETVSATARSGINTARTNIEDMESVRAFVNYSAYNAHPLAKLADWAVKNGLLIAGAIAMVTGTIMSVKVGNAVGDRIRGKPASGQASQQPPKTPVKQVAHTANPEDFIYSGKYSGRVTEPTPGDE